MTRRLTLWIVVIVGGSAAYRLVTELAARVEPAQVFGGVFIAWGWLYALAGLSMLVAIILVYAVAITSLSNNLRGRRRTPWPLFMQGVTHLILLVTLLLVYYPVMQVVAASFDPRNTLFSFKPVESSLLLVRAKVLPDLSVLSWSNYLRLVDGVVIYWYQWASIALMLATLMSAALISARLGFSGSNSKLERLRTLAVITAVLATATLLLTLVPEQFTGRATEAKFMLWVRNTLLVAGSTGFLSVALTATAGYAFARFRFLPGRFPMLMGFIFVQMFPGFLTLIAIYYLMSHLELLNTLTGLVLAYSGAVISFGTWIYKGYLESLGPSLEEAALVDGATRWQAFIRVIAPLSMPIFVFIFLMQFVGAYSEFILANLFLTGVDSWTVGIGLYSFTSGQFNTRWGIFSAASILGSLPILVIFYVFQRAFVSGYTAGGVKE